MSQGFGQGPGQPQGFGQPPAGGGGGGFGAPPGGGGFGAPPGGAPPAGGGSASGMAIAALVLGIASWFCGGIFLSIPGAIIGKIELGKIDRGESAAAGSGMAKAGFWISVINVAATLIFGLLYCIFMIFVASSTPSGGTYSY
ncbi:MAG: DUF4190 domain-containing protein [Myxococcota bacterium]